MDESFHGASFGASLTFLVVVFQAKDRRKKVIVSVTVLSRQFCTSLQVRGKRWHSKMVINGWDFVTLLDVRGCNYCLQCTIR